MDELAEHGSGGRIRGEVAQGLAASFKAGFRDPTNYLLGQNFDREWEAVKF